MTAHDRHDSAHEHLEDTEKAEEHYPARFEGVGNLLLHVVVLHRNTGVRCLIAQLFLWNIMHYKDIPLEM